MEYLATLVRAVCLLNLVTLQPDNIASLTSLFSRIFCSLPLLSKHSK